MDRNTLIGFGLIGALLIGMFVINSKSKQAYDKEQAAIAKRIADSLALIKPKVDSVALKLDAQKADSLKLAKQTSGLLQDTVKPQSVSIENDVVKITFSTKGAQPTLVELKKYKKFDSSLVQLQAGSFNKFSYAIKNGIGGTAQTENINFIATAVTKNADNSQTISFKTGDTSGTRSLVHQYTLKPGEYMLDLNIITTGNDWFDQNAMNINWQSEASQVEKDHKYELTQSHVCFVTNDNFDFEYAAKPDSKAFSKSVNWVAAKQQFFIAALIAKTKFESGSMEWKTPADSSTYLFRTTANLKVAVPAAANATTALQFYYGPSDYNILKKYDNQLQNIVPYGTGIFSFVKYINRYFLLPVFDFLQNNIASMGIVILLVTLLIRLITSPILYKSYLSGAKMKVLKPEVDALKAKFTDKTGQLDQQSFSMEQMKLWRTAGVSPLGGCLPALLQIPIFMSLYYFFQSNIDLRGKNFLWANDLASYDSILKLPFEVPFYGDHVSLFTLTAVATSLLISIYSMSNMQDNSNPLMKYMPYIFPVLLLGVFNKLPAALTWYYTVSNTITLILQIVIQKYVIDHDKILAQINENRKKPVKKSKIQEKVEAMQESQRKLQELKNKTNKN
ncbi:membrane protein insertase YidC [Ferruginibacter yonginensis]|uniref:Membrane protein insertase YidC n=1 Tax=Ferruginibacter yonginensis TaxID=1310416 RepID=A0ABV8QPK6_9BACT